MNVRRVPLLLIDLETEKGAFPTEVQNPVATSLFLFGSDQRRAASALAGMWKSNATSKKGSTQ
jgi:hypothetical protein